MSRSSDRGADADAGVARAALSSASSRTLAPSACRRTAGLRKACGSGGAACAHCACQPVSNPNAQQQAACLTWLMTIPLWRAPESAGPDTVLLHGPTASWRLSRSGPARCPEPGPWSAQSSTIKQTRMKLHGLGKQWKLSFLTASNRRSAVLSVRRIQAARRVPGWSRHSHPPAEQTPMSMCAKGW